MQARDKRKTFNEKYPIWKDKRKGGSGTSDAGMGMLKALVTVFAKGGKMDDVLNGPMKECRFTLACDVRRWIETITQ